MTQVIDDIAWLADLLEDSPLLFYGELEELLDKFLPRLFAYDFPAYGFGSVPMTDDFATAYWLFVSWACRADLLEYGTSPRGAWLTDKGKRFKQIIQDYEHPIQQACELSYRRNHS